MLQLKVCKRKFMIQLETCAAIIHSVTSRISSSCPCMITWMSLFVSSLSFLTPQSVLHLPKLLSCDTSVPPLPPNTHTLPSFQSCVITSKWNREDYRFLCLKGAPTRNPLTVANTCTPIFHSWHPSHPHPTPGASIIHVVSGGQGTMSLTSL